MSAGLEPVVLGGIVLNVLSTVGIVIINKFVFKEDKFEFMLTLSCCHFCFTAIGVR